MGLFITIPVAILFILPVLTGYFMIMYLLLRNKLNKVWFTLVLMFPLVLVFMACVAFGLSDTRPRKQFRKYVTTPIPDSVKNIRTAAYYAFSTHGWIFQFSINTNDLQDVIKQHNLHKCESFDLMEIIRKDRLLLRVKWISDIPTKGDFSFFMYKDNYHSVYLVHDRNTCETWFALIYMD
jgi:hypothetical protein